MKNFKNFFKNKTVIVTGHTGFKGSWLTLWMVNLGAKVVGISDKEISKPSHFDILKLKKKIIHKKVDVRDLRSLKKIFVNYKPDYVFHLAAQALVKKSFMQPNFTWETNTIGTLNVLESLRHIKKKCITIMVTSDKVYKNTETNKGYKEDDIIGGKDPYSASKSSAELVIKSYIDSFFSSKNNKVLIAIARAGNVIGGGDWSADRVIPDCIKSWSKNKRAVIRNPKSTRPWQHVLEAIWGYIFLAINLNLKKNLHGEAFNFGPKKENNFKVIELIKLMEISWPGIRWQTTRKKKFFFEANLLRLNIRKAESILKWRPILDFTETIKMTTIWYKLFYSKKIKKIISIDQINFYRKLLQKKMKVII